MEEGYSTNKPWLFKGVKYDYWKEHMITHFESIHINFWDVAKNGNYIPLNEQLNKVPKTSWTDAKKQKFMLNSKAWNALLCALLEEEYSMVHNYRSARQMWDILSLTYEGLTQIKHNKLNLLTHKYELFTLEEKEDIQTMFGHFKPY